MSVRTTTLTFTAVDGTGAPLVGNVTFTLTPPSVGDVLKDTAGELVDTTVKTVAFDNTGTVSLAVIPNGDITPVGSTWTVAFSSTKLINSFAYSGSPIDPTTWAPSGVTLGLLKMTLTDIFGDTSPVVGRTFRVALSEAAIWSSGIGGGQPVSPLGFFTVTTDSSGVISCYLVRTSELDPTDSYYILTEQGGLGAVLYFLAPTLYTNDAGAWSVGTTYALNAVARRPSDDVPFISLAGSNTGNALTDATKWALYAGEKITAPANRAAPGGSSAPRIGLSGLLYGKAMITGTTATLTEANDFVAIDATANNIDVTLPASAVWSGKPLFIRRVDATAHTVTLSAPGSDTILSAGTYTGLTTSGLSVTIILEGTDWEIY